MINDKNHLFYPIVTKDIPHWDEVKKGMKSGQRSLGRPISSSTLLAALKLAQPARL
jgi:hypothetical protein